MTKRYNRYKHVPFIEPQPESIYQKIRRAEEPIKKALELKVLDTDKLRKIEKEIKDIAIDWVTCFLFFVAFLTLLNI